MLQKLALLEQEASQAISACDDMAKLQDLKISYLGKKGEITQISRQMGQIDPKLRPEMGQAVNKTKESIEALAEAKMKELYKLRLKERLEREK